MTLLYRVEMVGSGWVGGPGMSVFYFDAGSAASVAVVDPLISAVRAAYTTSASHIVTGCSYNHNAAVKVLDSATGMQVGELASTVATSSIPGSDSGSFIPRDTMVKLRYSTNVFVAGRRVRGGPYIGPVGQTCIAGDGTLSTANVAQITAAFNTMMTAAGGLLVCWHRPVNGAGGVSAPVLSITTGTKPAVLRSRRD